MCCLSGYNSPFRLQDFLASLMNFQKDEINEETVELLEPYMEMVDFNFEGAKKVSSDVAGLASWVIAMCIYFTVIVVDLVQGSSHSFINTKIF